MHSPKSKYENRNDEHADDHKSVCVPVIVFSLLLVVDLRGTVVLRTGHARHVDPSGVGIERPEFGPRWGRTSIQMILGRKSGARQ